MVVAIRFSFDGSDCVGNAFEFSGMDVKFAMINDAVVMWTSAFFFSLNSYLVQK